MCTHDVSMLYSPSDGNYVGGTVNLGERPKQNLKLLPAPILSLLHVPPSALGCYKPCCQHHPPTPTHTVHDSLHFLRCSRRVSCSGPYRPLPPMGSPELIWARVPAVNLSAFRISIPLHTFSGYIFSLRILFCSSYLPSHFWQYLVPSSYTQYLLSF